MNYSELVKNEESKIIAVDFDGVIHSFEHGYYDGTIYGTPIVGSIEALNKLHSENYKIILYTTKAKKDRPLVNGKTGIELIWEWLAKYKINHTIYDITAEKPRAICYIDDKAIRFINWDQTIQDLYRIYLK